MRFECKESSLELQRSGSVIEGVLDKDESNVQGWRNSLRTRSYRQAVP